MDRPANMETVPEDRKCQYNYLGRSGLRVSNIALGALTFGEHRDKSFPGQLNESDAHHLIQRYVAWGGNFIDTADFYGYGTSERVVGSWLSGQERDRFVIATKVFFAIDGSNPNDCGTGRRHVTSSIDKSLKRLQTDYVDLYQIHMWDDATPIEETLRTLHDLVRCGKVRYLGASNVTGWQMQKIVCLTQSMGLNPFISLQQQYSLASRDSELEPFQVCKLNGIGVLPWSPLKGGVLTGKYKRDERPTEGRIAWASEDSSRSGQAYPSWDVLHGQQRLWDTLHTMERVARHHDKSVAQVALRWLLQKPIVTSVVVGANRMAQLEDNMGAANGWTLTEQEMADLDAVSAPSIPAYPYGMIWDANKDRRNPWNPTPYV